MICYYLLVGWVTTKNVSDVISLFLDGYNSKNPEHILQTSEVHLETAAVEGVKIYSDAKIDGVLEDRGDYFIIKGVHISPASSTSSANVATKDPNSLRCKNYGCNAFFLESENHDTACTHHIAPPFFHDTAKGWQCCREKKAYDWDDFQAIKGCTVGRHSTVEQQKIFQESPTIAAAASASSSDSSSQTSSAPLRSIADYNSRNPTAATAASSAKTSQERKSTRAADGTARCLNKGCQKTFTVAENSPQSCIHHRGQAVFHDANKYWSCCPNKKCYDFDDFLAVKGCVVGYHDDGEIEPEKILEKVAIGEVNA
jgi:hypothetical protein